MGRPKKFEGGKLPIGGYIPEDNYEELTKLLGRKPISDFINEQVSEYLKKARRQQELKSMMESRKRCLFNSPIGGIVPATTTIMPFPSTGINDGANQRKSSININEGPIRDINNFTDCTDDLKGLAMVRPNLKRSLERLDAKMNKLQRPEPKAITTSNQLESLRLRQTQAAKEYRAKHQLTEDEHSEPESTMLTATQLVTDVTPKLKKESTKSAYGQDLSDNENSKEVPSPYDPEETIVQ